MGRIRILDPGPLCTVQDLGRYGFMRFGVPVSGALDHYAARVANLLVGNEETEAVLEATYSGPRFQVVEDTLLSVTGALSEVLVNQRKISAWSSFWARADEIVSIRPYKKGLRCYIGLSGGIDVPVVMGSRSTCLSGGFGGLGGRPLRRGDELHTLGPLKDMEPRTVPQEFIPSYANRLDIRVITGPQDSYFEMHTFLSSEYEISPQSNRMGYRLNGPKIRLKEGYSSSIISEPVVPGSIQVTPDGMPLIILSEQTVGGYAKIATVIWPDLSSLAQARPGDLLRFKAVTRQEAVEANREYFKRLNTLKTKGIK